MAMLASPYRLWAGRNSFWRAGLCQATGIKSATQKGSESSVALAFLHTNVCTAVPVPTNCDGPTFRALRMWAGFRAGNVGTSCNAAGSVADVLDGIVTRSSKSDTTGNDWSLSGNTTQTVTAAPRKGRGRLVANMHQSVHLATYARSAATVRRAKSRPSTRCRSVSSVAADL
jgi:hypothetical protein